MNHLKKTKCHFRLPPVWNLRHLHRAERMALERDKLVAEWVKLTGEVSTQVVLKPQGGRPEDGIRRASRDLRLNREDVRRATKVASLSPEAQDAAREVGIDGNRSALLEAALALNGTIIFTGTRGWRPVLSTGNPKIIRHTSILISGIMGPFGTRAPKRKRPPGSHPKGLFRKLSCSEEGYFFLSRMRTKPDKRKYMTAYQYVMIHDRVIAELFAVQIPLPRLVQRRIWGKEFVPVATHMPIRPPECRSQVL